jgi:hypothetical protein
MLRRAVMTFAIGGCLGLWACGVRGLRLRLARSVPRLRRSALQMKANPPRTTPRPSVKATPKPSPKATLKASAKASPPAKPASRQLTAKITGPICPCRPACPWAASFQRGSGGCLHAEAGKHLRDCVRHRLASG